MNGLEKALRKLGIWRNRSLPEDERLSQQAKRTLLIHFIFSVASSMAGVFLNVYLWRLGNDFRINVNYHLILFLIVIVGFLFGGWFVKKYDRIFIYRVGIGITGLFYLAVILAQEQVLTYYLWFGFLSGICHAFYWVAYMTLMYDVSTNQNRVRFLAIHMTVFTLGNVIGPAIAGQIIYVFDNLTGYTIVFAMAAAMFIGAVMLSFQIPSLQLSPKPILLQATIKRIWENPAWRGLVYGFICIGLFQGIVTFLPNVLLFRYVAREDWIGYLGMLTSLTTVFGNMVIARFSRTEHARVLIVGSTLLLIVGAGAMCISLNMTTLLIFLFLQSISAPIIWNIVTSRYFAKIGTHPGQEDLRVESIIIREAALNIGRILAVWGLLVWASDLDATSIAILFFVISLAQVAITGFIRKAKSPLDSPEVSEKP